MRKITVMCGIPRDTLHTYITGQSIRVERGAPAAITPEKEGIVAALVEMHAKGFPVTRLQLKMIVIDRVRDGRYHKFSELTIMM